MSELLDLANAYYTVAKDLERRGRELLEDAEHLSQCADRICEENMRINGKSSQQHGADHG